MHEEPLLAYLCDTHTRAVAAFLESCAQLPHCVMVECTFLDPAEEARAEDCRHVHWNALEAVVRAYPSVTFVLFHFSMRYDEDYILQYFEGRNVPNVHLFLDSGVHQCT